MTNLQRLLLEIQGIDNLVQEELSVYLQENNLQPHEEYNAQSQTSKRNIYKTALSILNSISNSPSTMKNYKMDDTTISDFANNIQNRIDQLERTIRNMLTDDQSDSNFFMLFNA